MRAWICGVTSLDKLREPGIDPNSMAFQPVNSLTVIHCHRLDDHCRYPAAYRPKMMSVKVPSNIPYYLRGWRRRRRAFPIQIAFELWSSSYFLRTYVHAYIRVRANERLGRDARNIKNTTMYNQRRCRDERDRRWRIQRSMIGLNGDKQWPF